MTSHTPSKPRPTEQPPSSSVFKEESPQPWEELKAIAKKLRLLYAHDASWDGERVVGFQQGVSAMEKEVETLLLTTKLELLTKVRDLIESNRTVINHPYNRALDDVLDQLTTMKEEL